MGLVVEIVPVAAVSAGMGPVVLAPLVLGGVTVGAGAEDLAVGAEVFLFVVLVPGPLFFEGWQGGLMVCVSPLPSWGLLLVVGYSVLRGVKFYRGQMFLVCRARVQQELEVVESPRVWGQVSVRLCAFRGVGSVVFETAARVVLAVPGLLARLPGLLLCLPRLYGWVEEVPQNRLASPARYLQPLS